jgi:hypothetical protein
MSVEEVKNAVETLMAKLESHVLKGKQGRPSKFQLLPQNPILHWNEVWTRKMNEPIGRRGL